jgi:hypothetical protein
VQGKQFVIKAEVSIDSDDEASVRTSDDEFKVDDEGVKEQYTEKVTALDRDRPEAEKKRIEKLEGLLAKNDNSATKDVFGRERIFLVASFNDWQPVELKTVFHIKAQRKHGVDFEEWVKATEEKNPSLLVPKKKEENALQYTNYLPPGKHYFYFVRQG